MIPNLLIFQFASGNIFFVGLGLVAASLVFLPHLKGILARSLARTTFLIGVIGVACSGIPLPIWLYIPTGLLAMVCLIWRLLPIPLTLSKQNTVAPFLFCIIAAVACAFELSYRTAQRIPVAPSRTIYVIGDSVSAGIGGNVKPWPEILGEAAKREVLNLARAGATASSAMRQVDGIKIPHSLVFLEIGGNDILGDRNPAEFRSALEALLARLTSAGHEVAMFELPLPPFGNAFGKTQRFLARKYGVFLIPKTFLANVFATENATTDGIHLTQLGQDAFARGVQAMMMSVR